MDGLSAAASIIAVLQLTGEVIGYLNDVKDAPKECQQCTIEASNIQSLLINLRYRLEQGQAEEPWFTGVRTLNIENGPLDQYKQALEQLRSRIEIQDGMQKAKRRLLWKFRKEEVASILARIERLKSLVNIALEMDHFKLSEAIKANLQILQNADQAIKEDTTFLRDSLPNLQTDILTIRDTQHLQWGGQQLQQFQLVLDWISLTDFPARQHDIISRRQKGTGQWLLDSPAFKEWLQGAHKTLFCPGIPGAGKTMMAAIAIDHLRTLVQTDVGLAYVFCNYKSQVDQNLHNILSALLKQLVQNRADIAVPVTRLYDQYSDRKSSPSLEEIFTTLLTVCSNYTGVYVVLDALDECTDQDGTRSQLIEKLRDLQMKANVRLLLTSRFIPEITEKFRLDLVLEVQASEDDVKHFVTGQIPRLPSCIRRDVELTRAVQSTIVKAIGGMFLLARLYVDSLLDKRTKQKVLSTLENLSKETAALDKAYSNAIERIDGQLAEDRLLARRTISWLSYAKRPLTTQELCHALAIVPGDRALNGDNIYDVEDIISVCAGLVTIDKESNIICLVHYTTQEYFEQIRLEWNPSALEEIASICLTCLTFDTLRSGSCRTVKDFKERVGINAFLDYAAWHWAEHVRPVEETVSELAMVFLLDNALVSCSTQIISMEDWKLREEEGELYPESTTGLHLSAKLGLVLLSMMLLMVDHKEFIININAKDYHGWTPLFWAAQNGHKAVVKLLLETGEVEVDSNDDLLQTPLLLAARNGHEAVVKLLLERGQLRVNLRDFYYGRTPLSWAAVNGHEAVLKLLLQIDQAEVNVLGNGGETPLLWAAKNGYEAIVKLLLERAQVRVNLRDYNFGRTPLLWAASNRHEAVIKLLLQIDEIEVNLQDKYGQTPLLCAAARGHEAIVKLLLEKDQVDVNLQDLEGQTPLVLAVKNGYETVVKLLLQTRQVKVNLQDEDGETPLLWAAAREHETNVKLLLEKDQVQINLQDKYGRTPLLLAARNGYEAIVKLLLQTSQVQVNLQDKYGQTPLLLAAEKGHESVVKLLLQTSQVQVNFQDKYGQTPLLLATKNGHESVVKLLLQTSQVQVNFQDKYGQTPLLLAAEKGHESVVKLLLQTSQVQVNFQDKYGQTPLLLATRNKHEATIKLLHEHIN